MKVNPKTVLVTTTSFVEGLKIKKHIKPVSAHLVAGTNLFNDFLGGVTDVFGGRSNAYQKQLSSLYNEAIEKLKQSTYELGGNCVLGLSIDMDEISGKGKSMFMLTALGTAVVIENDEKLNLPLGSKEKLENVGIETINGLRNRKILIEKAKDKQLVYDDLAWDFITSNQVTEVFPFLLEEHENIIQNFESLPDQYANFHKNFLSYVDNLEEYSKLKLLYSYIDNDTNYQVALYLTKIIKELCLFDYEKTMSLLKNADFKKQKIGLRIAGCGKPFFNRNDIEELKEIVKYIASNFKERGKKSKKKQLLSSKEKEVWDCECGNTSNEIGGFCNSCHSDIFGFKQKDVMPEQLVDHIVQKIELIEEFIQ